jgi:hypothetical protein
MSGSVVDKAPQNDPTVLESAFSYKMIAEVVPYVPFQIVDLSLTNFTTAQLVARTNQARVNLQLQNNSTDLRLSFVWPLLPGNKFGNGRQTFRLLTGGQIVRTNDFIEPGQRLFFLEPSTYANVLFKP